MPEDFNTVFKAECIAIEERRKLHLSPGEAPLNVEDTLFGVCFSGGGIRSATFNLGVLQGLADRGLLELADYLSTVSGGGYIGSWFHGLSSRNSRGAVETYLKNETNNPGPADKDPITFLRKYSNYLAPQLGGFSTDTWLIFTIWLRNTFLNQIILLLSLSGGALIPLVLGNLARQLRGVPGSFGSWFVATALPVAALLTWVVFRMCANLKSVIKREFPPFLHEKPPDNDGSTWLTLVSPVVFAALILSFLIAAGRFDPVGDPWRTGFSTFLGLFILFMVSLSFGGFVQCYKSRHKKSTSLGAFVFGLLIISVCSSVTMALLTGLGHYLPSGGQGLAVWHCITWGPPLCLLALAAGVALQIGFMGVDFPDSAREWYARLGAQLLIVSVTWIAVFVLTVFGPMVVIWFFHNYQKTGIGTAVTWVVTTFAGIQAGKSTTTAGTPVANMATPPARRSSVTEVVAKLAPPLAVFGLLLAVSTGCFMAIEKIWPMQGTHVVRQAAGSTAPANSASMSVNAQGTGSLQVNWSSTKSAGFWNSLQAYPHDYRALALETSLNWWVFGSWACLSILALLISARVNINEFSMNHFYKNRLVRCYLGASHGSGRHPNPFTGFDPHDDILLTDLVPGPNYDAPYAIVNCALNLNHGSELAWQERKASSFVFTPLYCGYKPAASSSHGKGYFPTAEFTQPGGPRIGLATAISGAAASPNWGYHTSPVTAFLMTIFDVRLGWWVGNTRNERTAKTPGPRVALKYLFGELLGLTDEGCPYMNLSDGGHFENLGLYELIRRKCRFIIVGDGEQDENYVFESLGGAIRKARIDFGVDIDISPQRMFLKDGASTVHCATGTIDYHDGKPEGSLLYIKSSVTGDEPYDISQYKKAHGDFPHESTLNQFFTESQFESYRALGRHAVDKIFAKTTPAAGRATLDNLFGDLKRNWLPPVTARPGAFTKHSTAYSDLLQRLAADDDLRFLDSEILPGFNPVDPPPGNAPAMRKATFLLTDFIQLMEDVYLDLNLEDDGQATHQQNQGWILLFKAWGKPGTHLDLVWKKVGSTYGIAFQRFYDRLSKSA